jgi:hypothetical protein
MGSPHNRAKVERLCEELEASRSGILFPPALHNASRDAVFTETDSLIGWINVHRRTLSAAWHNGLPITSTDLDQLEESSRRIEDRPGLLKAALLRRAATGQQAPWIPQLLSEIEWGGRLRRRWEKCWNEGKPWV